MSSLFIRIYFSTLVFLMIAFFVVVYVVNSLIPDDQLFDNSDAIEKTLSHYLKSKPQESWQQEVRVFDNILPQQNLTLVRISELNKSEIKRLKESATRRISSDNKIDELYILYQIPNSNWLIKIQEKPFLENTINDWLDFLLPMLLLFTTLAFGLFLLIRKLTKPIEHLTIIAEKLGKGELDVRAKSDLPRPMDTLATGFNNMADQLHETIQEQQILIGAIPHELRSPLGRIRFALDLTRNKDSVEELREHIEKIDQYVDDMQESVDDILELNRLQNKQSIAFEKIELCELIEALSHQFTQNFPDIKLNTDCKLTTKTQGNHSLLKHAIQNLLDNATRYTKSEISINVWQENKQTVIQIDDNGNGIPEDNLNSIFMPFVTTDSSRNRKTGGIGLGLALVKIIIKKHGGNVVASRNPQGGARFRLFW